ncbi:MAG: DegV family protein [Clostridiales bacterium]|nr:DegV family protein [Clostridiales bacterium]
MSMKTKVAIVTDSSCDLPKEIVEKYNLHIIPIRVISSQGEFRDGIDITPDQLYQLMEKEIPKTSLPLPEEIHQLYASLYDQEYTHILHFSISSKLSGTYNVSRLVAQEFEDENNIEIHVIDTLTLSAALGLIVIQAAELLASGVEVEQVIQQTTLTRKNQLGCLIVKTLEYLRKGGRIGLVEGVVGNLLRIRPVIYVNIDGVFETMAKARGYLNALDVMIREVVDRFSNKKIHLAVVHGAAFEEAA